MKYFLLLGFLLFSFKAFSRPEYAARLGVNSCQNCHFNPSGAGLRNPEGKFYGWRARQGVWDGEKKYWHLDLRMNGLYPQRPTENNNGFSLMSALAGVSLPIQKKGDQTLSQIVLTYDMSSIAPHSPREAYVQFLNPQGGTWTVGRYLPPFGILTDEHRAYTRLQNKTTVYDFEMGGMYSLDISQRLHLDVALTSGFAQGGKFTGGTTNTPEQTSALFFNARWSPQQFPGFVGSSLSNHQSLIVTDAASMSLYGALSLERTKLYIPLHILGEVVWARGWNNQKYNSVNIGQFIPASDLALQAALEKAESVGLGSEVNYEISPWWILQYRYDRLALDSSYSGDVFQRHGAGVKYFITASTNLLVRYEFADSSVKEVPQESVRGNKNSFYMIFHAWL